MRRTAPVLLLMIVLAALVAGCGKYGTRYTGTGESGGGSSAERLVTSDVFDDAEKARAGCSDVREFENEGREHTQDPKEKVDYKTNPPTSGSHFQVASEWGIYDTQQPDVKTTHGLEHGYLVISHAGLSDAEVDDLTRYVKRDPTHVLLQPRPANPREADEKAKAEDEKAADEKGKSKDKPKAEGKVRKGIYYSAWTAQMFCEEPSAPALQFMLDEWRDQGPELFSSDPGMGTN